MSVITITLTDHPPVRVSEDSWPVTATASTWEGQYEFQAFRRARVSVRQHDDGRTVVYGWHSTDYPRERDSAAGMLLHRDTEGAIVEAIRAVAERIGHPELAAECIGDLPPVDVDVALPPRAAVA